jgi:hypothetical protein
MIQDYKMRFDNFYMCTSEESEVIGPKDWTIFELSEENLIWSDAKPCVVSKFAMKCSLLPSRVIKFHFEPR